MFLKTCLKKLIELTERRITEKIRQYLLQYRTVFLILRFT